MSNVIKVNFGKKSELDHEEAVALVASDADTTPAVLLPESAPVQLPQATQPTVMELIETLAFYAGDVTVGKRPGWDDGKKAYAILLRMGIQFT